MFRSVFEHYADETTHWYTLAVQHLEQLGEKPVHLFHYPSGAPPVSKTLYHIEKPMLNMDTNSYKDIESLLVTIFCKLEQQHRLAIIFGDEQLVALIWSCITEDPDQYMWVLPFPGEFHLTLHICHGIFRLFANLVTIVANSTSRQNITIDFKSCYWNKQEDFLLMMIEGTLKWLLQLKDFSKELTVGEILNSAKTNPSFHYLVYFLFQFGLFYWNLRQQLRKGNVQAITYAWKYCWPLFHCTNKFQYAKLCMIATYIQEFSHDAIKEVLNNRLCNLKGIPGHCIGTDMLTEKVT
jgi:hypothetical protein